MKKYNTNIKIINQNNNGMQIILSICDIYIYLFIKDINKNNIISLKKI